MNDPSGPSGAGDKRPLATRHCKPCEGATPALSSSEIGLLGASVPTWQVVEQDGVKRLTRTLRLADFRAAIAFVNRVAELAEAEAHHPDLTIRFNLVTVSSWTHVAKGLTENDFILASRIDALTVGEA